MTNAQSRKRENPRPTTGQVAHRLSLRVLPLAVFATGLAMALAPPASSASVPCRQRVIADWSKHGSIAGTYPASCMRQAMQNEPTDLRVYSNLDESLQHALAQKSRTARRLTLAVAPAPVPSLDAGGRSRSRMLLVFVIGSLGLALGASAVVAGRLRPRVTEGPSPPTRRGAERSDQATIKLAATAGFLVTDRSGKTVGRVESPMYGTAPDEPDALAVKAGLFQRSLVMADTIESIDEATGVIVLGCERHSIPTFL